MALERTLVLVKPDAFEKHHSGDIIKRYESEGLRIAAMKLLEGVEKLVLGFLFAGEELHIIDKQHFLYRVFDLYYDGFRNMKLGRTLWAIIIVKLLIIFLILKLFFFPNFLKTHAPAGQEADYVWKTMSEKGGQEAK